MNRKSRISKLNAVGFLLAGGVGASVAGCGPTQTTCADGIGCVTGTSGTSGNAGASGHGGVVAAGAAGSVGDSGAGGSGGSTSGAGGGGKTGGSGSMSGGAAGDGGAAGEVVPPCDTTKSPSVEACIVSNDFAIFVAPTGKDSASGTKAGPVKTIAKAVELAGTTKVVIACDGSYDEQVKLTAGAKMYGGFACPGGVSPWSYESGNKAKVAPTARGIALNIASGAASVVIEDFEFDAKDGVDPGESSVAAFVNTSTNVALTRVKLVAGKGVDGADGTLTKVTFPAKTDLNGNAAAGNSGGALNAKTCTAGGTTTGGKGGDGGSNATGGALGLPDLGAGKGGVIGSCSPNGTGQDGANASPQPPALGATKLGTVTPTGWGGVAGADGTPGTPGQGGGGGTGKSTSGGGGGGGAGGCGGAGGTGGKAGGSSIALLVLNSTIAMASNELTATDAGKGGNGVLGQGGQLESGDGGVQVPAGCPGGQGGLGGTGGAGGGAAGGISVGIAYSGMAPMPDAGTMVTTGTAGAKGIGGVAGTNDGIPGVKQDVLQVQ